MGGGPWREVRRKAKQKPSKDKRWAQTENLIWARTNKRVFLESCNLFQDLRSSCFRPLLSILEARLCLTVADIFTATADYQTFNHDRRRRNRRSYSPLSPGLWNVGHRRHWPYAEANAKSESYWYRYCTTVFHSTLCGVLYCEDTGYAGPVGNYVVGGDFLPGRILFEL
jgi:hypothetical protein